MKKLIEEGDKESGKEKLSFMFKGLIAGKKN
jgi:hypothetical protein